MKPILTIASLLLISPCCQAVPADVPAESTDGGDVARRALPAVAKVPGAVRRDIQDRDCGAALEAIDRALAADAAAVDELNFLKGRVFHYLDGYWYTMGYCHFARGEHRQALDMCRKVAEAKRQDRQSGCMVESVNRYRAIYILGQIHHSMGQAAEVIRDPFPRANE